ncbi:MAG: Three-deoxy-D-manno-octulosonic-acid transferase protein [Gemmatimonadetes bacterium]|nr:Three-deoxy-D-manno-octulosonic-acid transferase protein [Gemmatimonadota bacterium]
MGYEGAARVAGALAAFAPASSTSKLVETFASRRGVLSRFEAFNRDSSRPLLWMHAPSVGEGLQARPVLDEVRARLPRVQLAYTYFSPSAASFARGLSVDFADVLPFDATPDVCRALQALRPTALVFSKLDVWPTLARQASARGTKLGLISATLSDGSSRRTGIAGALLREAYAELDLVGAISAGDADRLIALGVPANRVSVTGDTRYDQVWSRAGATDLSSPLLLPLVSERPTLVAGSTWPADEAPLLAAWNTIRAQVPNARLIIVPHEPTPAHLASIEKWGSSLGVARLGTADAGAADVVLVDRVGVLGELYALATVAYVGGGFHKAGLHSVLEPAAFGVPVMFGPLFTNSRDARLLVDADGGLAVVDASSLAAGLITWLGNRSERDAAGAAARAVVHTGLGAAERSFALVAELLG